MQAGSYTMLPGYYSHLSWYHIALHVSSIRTLELQNFRTSDLQNFRNSEIQNFRTSGLQKCRNAEMQNFRNAELQNFKTFVNPVSKSTHILPKYNQIITVLPIGKNLQITCKIQIYTTHIIQHMTGFYWKLFEITHE
jgi:hypothetical protein